MSCRISGIRKYDVFNGFSGMKRDVILKLCIYLKDDEISALFGMCQEHYVWRTHSVFINGRLKYSVIPKFFAHSEEDFEISEVAAGLRCVFIGLHFNPIYLNKEITEGIFHMNVMIEYGSLEYFYFSIGVDSAYGYNYIHYTPQTCKMIAAFCFGRLQRKAKMHSCFTYVDRGRGLPAEKEIEVPDYSLITVEMDMRTCTLAFIINDIKVEYVCVLLKNTMPMLKFGLSGADRCACTVLSVHRRNVPAPFPTGVRPKAHVMQPYEPYYA